MKEPSYTIKVNNTHAFAEEDLKGVDLVPTGPDTFHILFEHVSYHARVVSVDMEAKSMLIRVDGSPQEVRLYDAFDDLVQKLGLELGSSRLVKNVLAPMPGLVLDIRVEKGQSVEEGEPLLILEAMKMENLIKAAGEGVIGKILVSKGQPVEKNQLLIEFE